MEGAAWVQLPELARMRGYLERMLAQAQAQPALQQEFARTLALIQGEVRDDQPAEDLRCLWLIGARTLILRRTAAAESPVLAIVGAALTPLLLVPRLPLGWTQVLGELTTEELAAMVRQSRRRLWTQEEPGFSLASQQVWLAALAEPTVRAGAMQLLTELGTIAQLAQQRAVERLTAAQQVPDLEHLLVRFVVAACGPASETEHQQVVRWVLEDWRQLSGPAPEPPTEPISLQRFRI